MEDSIKIVDIGIIHMTKAAGHPSVEMRRLNYSVDFCY